MNFFFSVHGSPVYDAGYETKKEKHSVVVVVVVVVMVTCIEPYSYRLHRVCIGPARLFHHNEIETK